MFLTSFVFQNIIAMFSTTILVFTAGFKDTLILRCDSTLTTVFKDTVTVLTVSWIRFVEATFVYVRSWCWMVRNGFIVVSSDID